MPLGDFEHGNRGGGSLHPVATSSANGFLSSTDKAKLDTTSGTNTGDVTLTAVGASANANGASLSGQALTLQPASTSFPGVMTATDKSRLDATVIPAYTAVTAFSNSWVNYGSGFPDAAYLKDRDGFVWLVGLIKNGTVGAAAFTLPAGYRPPSSLHFPAVANALFGIVLVNSSGHVRVEAPSSNAWVDLSSVRFRVA